LREFCETALCDFATISAMLKLKRFQNFILIFDGAEIVNEMIFDQSRPTCEIKKQWWNWVVNGMLLLPGLKKEKKKEEIE
jgi:hypothetical protein